MLHFFREGDQGRRIAHVLDTTWIDIGNIGARCTDQVNNQGVDHAPHCFVDRAATADTGEHRLSLLPVPRKEIDLIELGHSQQTRTQAIVDIVIVVGDFIGQIGQLGFQSWLLFVDEALANRAELAGIGQ